MSSPLQRLNTAIILTIEENAEAALKLYANVYAELPEALDATHYMYWSKALIRKNLHEDAIEKLSLAISMAPDRADIQYQLVHILQTFQQTTLSNKVFENILRMVEPLPLDAYYIGALNRFQKGGLPLRRRYRYQMLLDALATTRDIFGAVVECGCAKGLSAYLIAHALRTEKPDFAGENMYIVDSFEGLSEPSVEDFAFATEADEANALHMVKKGAFSAALEQVQQNLSDFPRLNYVKGWIPDILSELPEQTYRFINLDVDLYEPYRGALEYFFPRLSPGGAISCDDYSPNWPGARKAIDAFVAKTPDAQIAYTDYMQAVITKR